MALLSKLHLFNLVLAIAALWAKRSQYS